MMEEVCERENLKAALRRVKANKGPMMAAVATTAAIVFHMMCSLVMASARLVRHSEGRKAEQWIGQAGNGGRRPEREGAASRP